MTLLSKHTPSKDNNFNLLRMLAASGVLISHSYALALGLGHADPLFETLGVTLGTLAVDLFFITSGFLVCASLLTRQSAKTFLFSRALRIYPALFIMVAFTVLIVGSLFTTLPLSSYFFSKGTLSYLMHNSLMVFGVRLELPGVFLTNPFPSNVNGSLWTLPYELGMYALLLALWVLSKLLHQIPKLSAGNLILLISIFLGTLSFLDILHFRSLPKDLHDFVHLGFSFFAGASCYVLKNHIFLSKRVFLVSLLLLTLSMISSTFFQVAFAILAPYLILFLAYIPSGAIRAYNKIGDYSYGVYIYAFLVQQSLCVAIPGISVWTLTLYASLITLGLAMASWHFIEKPALQLKRV